MWTEGSKDYFVAQIWIVRGNTLVNHLINTEVDSPYTSDQLLIFYQGEYTFWDSFSQEEKQEVARRRGEIAFYLRRTRGEQPQIAPRISQEEPRNVEIKEEMDAEMEHLMPIQAEELPKTSNQLREALGRSRQLTAQFGRSSDKANDLEMSWEKVQEEDIGPKTHGIDQKRSRASSEGLPLNSKSKRRQIRNQHPDNNNVSIDFGNRNAKNDASDLHNCTGHCGGNFKPNPSPISLGPDTTQRVGHYIFLSTWRIVIKI